MADESCAYPKFARCWLEEDSSFEQHGGRFARDKRPCSRSIREVWPACCGTGRGRRFHRTAKRDLNESSDAWPPCIQSSYRLALTVTFSLSWAWAPGCGLGDIGSHWWRMKITRLRLCSRASNSADWSPKRKQRS